MIHFPSFPKIMSLLKLSIAFKTSTCVKVAILQPKGNGVVIGAVDFIFKALNLFHPPFNCDQQCTPAYHTIFHLHEFNPFQHLCHRAYTPHFLQA